MKIILRKDIPDLGDTDDVKEVSSGYARNYLIPRGMVVEATPSALAAAGKRKAVFEKKMEGRKSEFIELAKKLSAVEVLIPADAGESGKLFGSITSQDIALSVREKSGIEVDKRKIELAEPIKMVGEYKVPVKIYQEIVASLSVKVVAKEK